MLQSLTQSPNIVEIQNTQIKDKESKRAERHKTIYIGSSYNTGVVQSPYTSKRFHYNHYDYNLHKDTPRGFSMLKHTARDF